MRVQAYVTALSAVLLVAGQSSWATGAPPSEVVLESSRSASAIVTIKSPTIIGTDDDGLLRRPASYEFGGTYGGVAIYSSRGVLLSSAFSVRGVGPPPGFKGTFSSLIWVGARVPNVTLPPGKYKFAVLADSGARIRLPILNGPRLARPVMSGAPPKLQALRTELTPVLRSELRFSGVLGPGTAVGGGVASHYDGTYHSEDSWCFRPVPSECAAFTDRDGGGSSTSVGMGSGGTLTLFEAPASPARKGMYEVVVFHLDLSLPPKRYAFFAFLG